MVSESVYKPFKSRISDPNNTLGLPDINPTGFQSQMFQGLNSLVQAQRFGVLDVGHKPPIPQEEGCEM